MILFFAGCATPLYTPDWEGGPFAEIRGPLEGELPEPGTSLEGFLVWTWVWQDRVGAAVQPTAITPELGGYSAVVSHPPAIERGPVEAPAELRTLGDTVVAIGTLVLVPSSATPPDVEPVPTFEALVDARTPVLYAGEEPVPVIASWTRERLALAGHVQRRVADHPGWTGQPCAIGDVGPGLTLYTDGPDCAWVPLGAPGELSVFEDVALSGQ